MRKQCKRSSEFLPRLNLFLCRCPGKIREIRRFLRKQGLDIARIFTLLVANGAFRINGIGLHYLTMPILAFTGLTWDQGNRGYFQTDWSINLICIKIVFGIEKVDPECNYSQK